jgi:hypothetical protein
LAGCVVLRTGDGQGARSLSLSEDDQATIASAILSLADAELPKYAINEATRATTNPRRNEEIEALWRRYGL